MSSVKRQHLQQFYYENVVFTENFTCTAWWQKCVTAIQCSGTNLPNFIDAQTMMPHDGLFSYAHEVIYTCDIGRNRFEDGNTITIVTCSASGWTWNHIVTSCKRTLILCINVSLKLDYIALTKKKRLLTVPVDLNFTIITVVSLCLAY